MQFPGSGKLPRRWKGTVSWSGGGRARFLGVTAAVEGNCTTRHVVLLSVLFFSYCRRVYLDPVRAQSNRDL